MSFTSFTIIVKTWGAVASPKGREVNWNTCDKTLGISLSLGGTREVLMDSGVSILNFSTCRKVLSLLNYYWPPPLVKLGD